MTGSEFVLLFCSASFGLGMALGVDFVLFARHHRDEEEDE